MSETEKTVDKEVGEILGAAFTAAAEGTPEAAATLRETLWGYSEEKIEAAKEALSEVYRGQKKADPGEAAQTFKEFVLICRAAPPVLGCLDRHGVFGRKDKDLVWNETMRNLLAEKGHGDRT